jgi:hypothetical protein
VSAIVVQTCCLLVHVRSFTIFINRCVQFASENTITSSVKWFFTTRVGLLGALPLPKILIRPNPGLTEQLLRNSYYGLTKLRIVVSQIH